MKYAMLRPTHIPTFLGLKNRVLFFEIIIQIECLGLKTFFIAWRLQRLVLKCLETPISTLIYILMPATY